MSEPTEERADAVSLERAVRFQRDLYLYWRTVSLAGGAPLTARHALPDPCCGVSGWRWRLARR